MNWKTAWSHPVIWTPLWKVSAYDDDDDYNDYDDYDDYDDRYCLTVYSYHFLSRARPWPRLEPNVVLFLEPRWVGRFVPVAGRQKTDATCFTMPVFGCLGIPWCCLMLDVWCLMLDAWCLVLELLFFSFPAHCLPGEYLNARAGECRLVTNASETQMFECTTGMRFYRCPLGDISCPGSSKICYETNKPPLVCEKGTTLAHCLQCRAAESAELYVKSLLYMLVVLVV